MEEVVVVVEGGDFDFDFDLFFVLSLFLDFEEGLEEEEEEGGVAQRAAWGWRRVETLGGAEVGRVRSSASNECDIRGRGRVVGERDGDAVNQM